MKVWLWYMQYGFGGCSGARTHERLRPIWAGRWTKTMWWRSSEQVENLRHRTQQHSPWDSHSEQHSIRAQPGFWHANGSMPEGENCSPQIRLPKKSEGPSVTCMKSIIMSHWSTFEKKEFMRLVSFFSLFSHACGTSSMLAGTPFPTLVLYYNLFPHTVLATGSHYMLEQFQSSSSPSFVVRMKVSSQSCMTCFDNTGLLSWPCSISMQNNEDCYYIWSIN